MSVIYWAFLLVGGGFLFLSVVVGDLLDFIDFDLGGADGVSFTGIIFAAMAGFGAGGLLALGMGWSDGASVFLGLVVAASFALLSWFVFNALAKAQAEDAFNLDKLIGSRGVVSVGFDAHGHGRVAVTYDGMTRAFDATAPIFVRSGTVVEVTDTASSSLVVKPITV